jgi:primosomal protein N' (replication factor Y)
VLKAALPSGLKLESETRISYNNDYTEQSNDRLSAGELLVFGVVREKKSLSILELHQSLQKKNSLVVVRDLLEKGAVFVDEEIKVNYRLKTEPVVQLADRLSTEKLIHMAIDLLKKTPLQQKLLMGYLELSAVEHDGPRLPVTKKELLHSTGLSSSILSGLVQKNILKIADQKVDILSMFKGEVSAVSDLSPAQMETFASIKQSFEIQNVTLLHGVTSSGKTEIYIQLIREYLDQGKQVLYLLPEIGLSTQIITRLTRVFGGKAGIYHSKFNDAERVEIWNKVLNFGNPNDKKDQNYDYQLIVGTRSAIFLPFQNLGLIVVDEEHENSYKQVNPSPR